MSKASELRELINQMGSEVPSPRGSQTVGWYAHRDAEKVVGEELVDAIAGMLSTERTVSRRRDLYFVLGCLAKNGFHDRVEPLLLAALAEERKRELVCAVLFSVQKLPSISDLSAIEPLLAVKTGQIRSYALQALAQDGTGKAEGLLQAFLENSTRRSDRIFAISSLARVATLRSYATFVRLTRDKTQDVASIAIAGLAGLGGVDAVPALVEALALPSSAAKWAATLALDDVGDSRAIAAVLARAKAIMKRPPTIERRPSELIAALSFLKKHAIEDAAVGATLRYAREEYLVRAFAAEARWIEQNLVSPR